MLEKKSSLSLKIKHFTALFAISMAKYNFNPIDSTRTGGLSAVPFLSLSLAFLG